MRLKEARLPPWAVGYFDFVYSFDVFVHLDLHTIWRYVSDISAALRPGGRSFLHTMNLTTPSGWKAFASQNCYSVEGHYFVSPEIVRILVERAGLELMKESSADSSNLYMDRDYLFVMEKPAARTA
jgi:cyclopropane fatty-acyl-phospholipid synthase-like methyltransferase